MPQIPITSTLGYIGIFFLISGVFLIISGTGIIKIENVTITKGRTTWILGGVLAIAGFIFLLPDVSKEWNSLTPTPSATTTVFPVSDGVVYENNFENKKTLDVLSGAFNVTETTNGNHVWRSTNSGESQITLPINLTDYAVESDIMQVSGQKGFSSIEIRVLHKNPCTISYAAYLDFFDGWLKLTEYDEKTCDEVGASGVFADYKISLSNAVWYKLRIESKDTEIKVFLDNQLVAQDIDTDGVTEESNLIMITTCCIEEEPFVFDFDNVKVWSINP